MNSNKQFDARTNEPHWSEAEATDALVLDPVLEETLEDFRLSVFAWSDAAYTRARQSVAEAPRHRVWRLAMGWALGCVLLAGGFSAGVFEHHENQARLAAQAREAEHQRQLAAARASAMARDEEDILAKVDSDVAREVPTAMEPLAQLMTGDETQ